MKMKNKVIAELKEILKNMDKSLINKIPVNLINAINNFNSNKYKFKYNRNKKLCEQDLQEETKNILLYIWIKYISNNEQRLKYYNERNKYFKKIEIKKKELYSSDIVFKKPKK